MKKILSVFLSLTTIALTLSASFTASAATYSEELINSGFTSEYAEKLAALHEKYPNWVFVPMQTRLNFSDAVNGERSNHGNQLIEKSYGENYFCSCSKCKVNGAYVTRDSGCYAASQQAVEYFMNPLNWLDEKHIFQFESNRYSTEHNIGGIEAILKNTWMSDSYISYLNTEGQAVDYTEPNGEKLKYSSAISRAAETYGVNAYYLASRIVKEVGSKSPTASGAAGNKAPFAGIYNYYSIGAQSGGMSGLEWASGYLMASKDTNLYSGFDFNTGSVSGSPSKISSGRRMTYIGTYGNYFKIKIYNDSGSYSTDGEVGFVPSADLRTKYFTYSRPWTSPYLSIIGGAQYIADSYIKNQYTAYLEKFNVNPDSGNRFSHEYMQNVDAPSVEAESRYNAYASAGELSAAKTFYIPVYGNTPAVSVPSKVTGLKSAGTSSSSISLKWNNVSGASMYYVSVKNLSKKSSFSKTVTTNSCKLKNLTKGTRYQIKVRAYGGGKWEKYSSSIKVRCVPAKAKLKKISSPKKGKIKLSWKKSGGAAGYQIVYSKKKNFKKISAKKNVKKTSYTGKGFKSKKRYYVKVRPYIVIKGKKYYGKYSAPKSVKVK